MQTYITNKRYERVYDFSKGNILLYNVSGAVKIVLERSDII